MHIHSFTTYVSARLNTRGGFAAHAPWLHQEASKSSSNQNRHQFHIPFRAFQLSALQAHNETPVGVKLTATK
ncbi:MAG: hypothetical protein C5B49_04665 [Bdellovibrio sp.]|nr:MAG: hypothetical protein C5B49_04665 [Bdellovibrio sp.]